MYEGAIQDLIDELGRLPGIGPKGAQRIAFHLLAAESGRRAAARRDARSGQGRGAVLPRSAATSPRPTSAGSARDSRRDASVICVVEEPKDVVAIERTREFRGRYHVLGGAISPIDGVGPDDLRIRELFARLRDGAVTEIILATDPNLEGEATATYLARLIAPMGLTVTRLASPACRSAATLSTPTKSPSAARSPAAAGSTDRVGPYPVFVTVAPCGYGPRGSGH